MKKRFLSTFLVLCMVLSLFPMTAFAEADGYDAGDAEPVHQHPLCGGTECAGDHASHSEDIEYKALDNGKGSIKGDYLNNGILKGGNYYLTADTKYNKDALYTVAPINLCLNGHTLKLTGGSVPFIKLGKAANLCDCVGGGKISNMESPVSGCQMIEVRGAEFCMYSGTIEAKNSVAVYNDAGSCSVFGGSLIGNGTNSSLLMDQGTLKLAGAPEFSPGIELGNTDSVIILCGPMTNAEKIAFIVPQSVDPKKIVIRSDGKYAITQDDLSKFASADSGFGLVLEGTGPDAVIKFAKTEPLTGSVTIDGSLKFNEALTAEVNDSNNTGTLSYQWKRGDVNIGENSKNYTTVAEDIGQFLSCVVTSSVENGSISGSAAAAVEKAAGPDMPEVTISFSDGPNKNKLIGATDAMEYSINSDPNWKECTAADMDMTDILDSYDWKVWSLFVRIKETATHEASEYLSFSFRMADEVTGVTAIGCTNASNNDGILKGVTADMEYHGSGGKWIAGTGEDITGLTDGVYWVRTRAYDNRLPGPSERFTISAFEPQTRGIALSPSDRHNFSAEFEGYTDIEPLTVTIRNTGNQPTGALNVALSGENADSFQLNRTEIASIEPDSAGDSFTIVPRTGLTKGYYSAAATVSGSEGLAPQSITVGITIDTISDDDAEKVAETKAAIEAALKKLSVSNSLTADKMLQLAREANPYSNEEDPDNCVKVEWSLFNDGTLVDFTKVDATKTEAGVIAGSFRLSLNAAWDTLTFGMEIPKLSNGGSSSGGGGGGSGSGFHSNITIVPPAAAQPQGPTQGKIKLNGSVNSGGTVSVSASSRTVAEAISRAEDTAKRNGNLDNGITIVLDVVSNSKSAKGISVNLPKAAMETIVGKEIANTVITVDNPDIQIAMDLKTVKEILSQANSDVMLSAVRTASGKLTGDAKDAVGSRPLYEFKLSSSGGTIQKLNAGEIAVTIPYTLAEDEKAEKLCAVNVKDNSQVQWLSGSAYDSTAKELRVTAGEFTALGVGYKPADMTFADISDHWAKEDIQFAVRRGLFSGIDDKTFRPDGAMTRGMFVTVLGKLAGADVSGCTGSSFGDVEAGAYYQNYVEWASKNGIVSGDGKGSFKPDASITRQEMAVIMENFVKATGAELSKKNEEKSFSDGTKIASWARDAVKTMQTAGVISGKDDGSFDPLGTATRAETCALLHSYMEGNK